MRNRDQFALPSVAHSIPGRLRLRIPGKPAAGALDELVRRLNAKSSVKRAYISGRSLVVEFELHEADFVHSSLRQVWPQFEHPVKELGSKGGGNAEGGASEGPSGHGGKTPGAKEDKVVANVAASWPGRRFAPLVFLGLAAFQMIRDGAFLAGESAFAIAYLSFDVYWKFQQENIMKELKEQRGESGAAKVKTGQAANARKPRSEGKVTKDQKSKLSDSRGGTESGAGKSSRKSVSNVRTLKDKRINDKGKRAQKRAGRKSA